MVVAAGVALGVVADVYCWMLMPKVLPFVCLYEIHVLMIYCLGLKADAADPQWRSVEGRK